MVLEKKDFITFMQKLSLSQTKRHGKGIAFTTEKLEEMYDQYFNKLNADREGVSLDDLAVLDAGLLKYKCEKFLNERQTKDKLKSMLQSNHHTYIEESKYEEKVDQNMFI